MSDTALPMAAFLTPERRVFEQMPYAASPFGALVITRPIFLMAADR